MPHTIIDFNLMSIAIIAHAKSGTGKTLIYVLSALNRILEAKKESIQCLILAPTREIAKQIYDVFKTVGYYVTGKYYLTSHIGTWERFIILCFLF